MSKLTKLGETVNKQSSKIKQYDLDLKRQESLTQEKRAIVLKFAKDVHSIVQKQDDKQYITGIMKLNQDYVLSQVAYNHSGKKRDPEALEELNKQFKYMEDLITQLKVNTTKNETRTRSDIKLKTKENTQLIVDLNNLKYENKKQRTVMSKKENEDRVLNEKIKDLKRKEALLRHELSAHQAHKHSTVTSEDNPPEDDKKRTSNKARLAEQAREDEADKAEIARLMVSAFAGSPLAETAGGEQ